MSERAEKLKPLIAELTHDEREELFSYFLDFHQPEELSDEWIDEINRRIIAYEKGESVGMPADEFMELMKVKHG